MMESHSRLDAVVDQVKKRLGERKLLRSFKVLREQAEMSRQPLSLLQNYRFSSQSLNYLPFIIAEIKFTSPALGKLQRSSQNLAVEIAGQYLASGAGAISVLCEQDYFHGNPAYLTAIRNAYPTASILMKDFIVDIEQIYEARIIGADAILLILALLNKELIHDFLVLAANLGLSVIIEVHNKKELNLAFEVQKAFSDRTDRCWIGVNNRNLKNLEVSIETSIELSVEVSRKFESRKQRILMSTYDFVFSESGINSRKDIEKLMNVGYRGFLIGSALMTSKNPQKLIQSLIEVA